MGQAPSTVSPFDKARAPLNNDVPHHELVPKTLRIDSYALALIQRRILRGDIAPFLYVHAQSIPATALCHKCCQNATTVLITAPKCYYNLLWPLGESWGLVAM